MKQFHEETHEEKFLKSFLKNEDLKKQKEIIGTFFKKPIWWFIRAIRRKPPKFEDTVLARCDICKKSRKQKSGCYSAILKILRKAKKTRRLEKFICSNNFSGFGLPIIQGDKIYGYIGLCHLDNELPRQPLELFVNFINILIKDVQKELELSRLYETIRPRAIALSTVHTIHRLISSTLDLDELLPRIARLCMQVMQANRCSVKLLDRKRNILVPVTTIDLRTKRKLHPKELKLGRGVPGRTAKTGRVLKGPTFISVPLIDEDVIGVITLYDKINKKAFTQFDQEIMMTVAEQAVIAIKNAVLRF